MTNLERTYYTVNVAQALHELKDVGELLRIAYAGTQGRPSSVHVISIMSNYQHMVKDTFVVTGSFISSCLTALSTHRIAMKFADKGLLPKALEKMTRCAEMAREMQQLCIQLKTAASTLVDASTKALESAVGEGVASEEEKKKIRERIEAAKIEAAEREARNTALDIELNRALAQEQAEISRQEQREQKQFILNLLKAGTGVIKDVASSTNPLAEAGAALGKGLQAAEAKSSGEGKSSGDDEGSASDRRLEAMRTARYEKEKDLRENNAKLARQLTELNQLAVSNNDLESAIKALEVAITSLGKIKTIFENTRLFWEGVEVCQDTNSNHDSTIFLEKLQSFD